MKNQAIQYLAFDVHQATTVATVRDEHGAIRLRATVPTEASAIPALVRGLGGRVLSEMLRLGAVKSVYHGASGMLTLKELVRCYVNLVDDSTRVMLRIKALFRARAIPTPGTSVYRVSNRGAWLAKIESRGARMRAASLLWQLDSLLELRPKAKADMIAEARRQPGWKVLRSIPFFGPARVALLLAIMATPFRFRTKRQL